MAIDHTNCTHPRTPAGRRVCRTQYQADMDGRAMTQLMNTPVPDAATRRGAAKAMQDKLEGMADAPAPRKVRAGANMTVPAPKARRQPKRSTRRVADDGSGCVQAALHTGRGRCACGWDTISATR